MEFSDIFIEKSVYINHVDGWGYQIKEHDVNGDGNMIEYEISYFEVDDDEINSINKFKINELLAKEFFKQGLELIQGKGE